MLKPQKEQRPPLPTVQYGRPGTEKCAPWFSNFWGRMAAPRKLLVEWVCLLGRPQKSWASLSVPLKPPNMGHPQRKTHPQKSSPGLDNPSAAPCREAARACKAQLRMWTTTMCCIKLEPGQKECTTNQATGATIRPWSSRLTRIQHQSIRSCDCYF